MWFLHVISPPKEKLLLWKSGWKTVATLLIKNRGNTESLMSQDDEVRLWIVPQEMVYFIYFLPASFAFPLLPQAAVVLSCIEYKMQIATLQLMSGWKCLVPHNGMCYLIHTFLFCSTSAQGSWVTLTSKDALLESQWWWYGMVKYLEQVSR